MAYMAYRPRTERRKEQRYAASIDCVMTWDGISQNVVIRNLSVYGLLIRGAYLPTIGERATVIADHLECLGTVAWRSQEQCGLLLSAPIDPLAILVHHAEWRVEALPPFTRPAGSHLPF